MARPHSKEYEQYLRSPRWKKFRKEIIAYRAYRCQDCLTLGTEYTLHVHHLNYDCLGHETHNDVLVLCPKCHEKADREREAHTKATNFQKRLDGWASNVYGEDWSEWADFADRERIAEEFGDWLENQSE